eukprot:TRINITY_DN892_c0_g1_i1.p1 TRINITY_DN892_c0_g1~~TRINITY_DN892_c0_g1_i1.p1  ORF type:complete len:323 (-),score=133.28 TRINITY_DN892_c0_g1_i1:202-1170(-)
MSEVSDNNNNNKNEENNNNEVDIVDDNEIEIKDNDEEGAKMKENISQANKPQPGKIDVSEGSEELDNKTKAEILSKIGHHKKQDCFVVYAQNDVEKEISGETGLSSRHTVYFKNCNNSTYTITDKCVKVFAESCENLTLTIVGQLYTETCEIWKCNNVSLTCCTSIKTLQVDQCDGVNVTVEDEDDFDRLIWAGLNNFTINVGNKKLSSGLDDVRVEFPEVRADIDQFIIRVVGKKLLQEKIIRLDNGYPTTERENNAFNEQKEKNDKAYENYVKQLLNQKQTKVASSLSQLTQEKKKKVGRNSPCPCNSGKKYKKCCGKNA